MTTVLAYLDPGSGSMILQILAGGIAAVAVTAKLYWGKILRFLRIRKDEPETHTAGQAGRHRLRLAPAARPSRRPASLVSAAGLATPPATDKHARPTRARLVPRPGEPGPLHRRRGLPRPVEERPRGLRGAGRQRAVRRRAPRGHRAGGGRGGCRACRPRARRRVLRHERIPFVSYPYEWPFGMLNDAALLQLDLLLAALDEDLMLKDSSPYNVMLRGAQPRSSSTSARSSGCARASRGSATASSACSSSIR